MNNVEIRVQNNLVLDGQVVGHRISIVYEHNSRKIRGNYDIGSDHLELIIQDFNPAYSIENNREITLIPSGESLIPMGAVNVPELTYQKYADLSEHDIMKETDVQLKLMYNRYNGEIFGGKLPSLVPIYWSNRMTSGAGVCRYEWKKDLVARTKIAQNFKIGLSVPYHDKFPEQIVSTLVHEMIHVLLPGHHHDHWFKAEMYRIRRDFGITISVHSAERATEKKYRYLYGCTRCDMKYERIKVVDLVRQRCGKCRSELFLIEDKTV